MFWKSVTALQAWRWAAYHFRGTPKIFKVFSGKEMAKNRATLLIAIFTFLLFSKVSRWFDVNTGKESKRTVQFREKFGWMLNAFTGAHAKQWHMFAPQILLWHLIQLAGRFSSSFVLNQVKDPFQLLGRYSLELARMGQEIEASRVSTFGTPLFYKAPGRGEPCCSSHYSWFQNLCDRR